MDPETLAELDAKKATLSNEWKSKNDNLKKAIDNFIKKTYWRDKWEPNTASSKNCEALLNVSPSSKTDQSTNHALTCKNCGSPKVEEEKGSIICTSCGTVLAESTLIFEETTGGSAQADGSMHVDGDTGSDDSQNFQNKASEISSENELDFEE